MASSCAPPAPQSRPLRLLLSCLCPPPSPQTWTTERRAGHSPPSLSRKPHPSCGPFHLSLLISGPPWGWFGTEVISWFSASPRAITPLCAPRLPGPLVSGAQLTFSLLRGQLSLCHSGQVPQAGGFCHCERVTALVRLSGAPAPGDSLAVYVWQRLCPVSVGVFVSLHPAGAWGCSGGQGPP